MRTPTGSRWVSNNYITRCHRRLGAVTVSVPVAVGVGWGQDASVRISLQTEGLRPSVIHKLSSPARMRKKCCYGQKNLGSICSSLSPSPTHLSHTTNINPLENKVWELYFYKEVCSFVHWSSSLLLTMFPLIFVYVYIYAAIQQLCLKLLTWLQMNEWCWIELFEFVLVRSYGIWTILGYLMPIPVYRYVLDIYV